MNDFKHLSIEYLGCSWKGSLRQPRLCYPVIFCPWGLKRHKVILSREVHSLLLPLSSFQWWFFFAKMFRIWIQIPQDAIPSPSRWSHSEDPLSFLVCPFNHMPPLLFRCPAINHMGHICWSFLVNDIFDRQLYLLPSWWDNKESAVYTLSDFHWNLYLGALASLYSLSLVTCWDTGLIVGLWLPCTVLHAGCHSYQPEWVVCSLQD